MAASDISLPRAVLAGLILEAILYGVYVVLFGIAMSLLIIKRSKNKVTTALILVTLFMFSICTSYEGLVIHYSLVSFLERDAGGSGGGNTLNRSEDPRVYTGMILEVINSVVGDAIVIWRAWVLWERSWKAVAIPAFFWLTSIPTGIGCSINGVATAGVAGLLSNRQAVPWAATFLGSTFMTNCASVVAITYRYLLYRREVSAVLGEHSSNITGIFIVVIESGVLYCFTWIISVILCFSGNRGVEVMIETLSPFMGIYPTLIVVLVCLKVTNKDDVEKCHWSVNITAATSDSLSSGQSCTVHPRSTAINQPRMPDGGTVPDGAAELEKCERPWHVSESTAETA